jgi:hypothetical protein
MGGPRARRAITASPVTVSVHGLAPTRQSRHEPYGTPGDPATGVRLLRAIMKGLLGVDEVMVLLISTCQGEMRAGWDDDLQRRTLRIVFAGLGGT